MQSILSDEHLMGSFGEISYLEIWGNRVRGRENERKKHSVTLFNLVFLFLFFFLFFAFTLVWFFNMS